MRIVHNPAPPTGVRRWAWRAPVLLYRCHLGRLLGDRVLMLTHTGRTSGKPRYAVLEVVEHVGQEYTVASGFGTGSNWYRNLQARPEASVMVRGRTRPVTARFLPAEEGSRVMSGYAARHPKAARRLCALMGYAVDGGDADFRAVGRHVPFVRLAPR